MYIYYDIVQQTIYCSVVIFDGYLFENKIIASILEFPGSNNQSTFKLEK